MTMTGAPVGVREGVFGGELMGVREETLTEVPTGVRDGALVGESCSVFLCEMSFEREPSRALSALDVLIPGSVDGEVAAHDAPESSFAGLTAKGLGTTPF